MHRVASRVHLPVLRELPVQRAAKTLEHTGRRLLPSWRGDERLGDREPRSLQDLGAFAVADVDRDGLEIHRPLIRAADQAHRQVRPDVLAVLARVPLLDAAPFFFAGEHAMHRLLQGGRVIRVRDVEQRKSPQLAVAVANQLAERRVDRRDVTVKGGECHAGLRLVEQGAESRLHLAFRFFGAQPFADVADQGQQLVAPGRHAVDRHVDLDAATRLGDHGRRVSSRGLPARQPAREVRRQLLSLVLRGERDEARHRLELGARVARQLDVSVVARHEATVLGDQQALAQIAEGRKERALACHLSSQVALNRAACEQREEPDPDQQQRPDHHRADGDHQLCHRVGPQQAEGGDRDPEHIAEMTRMQACVELQQHDREADGSQRRKVVAKPLAGHAEDQDGERRRRSHDR